MTDAFCLPGTALVPFAHDNLIRVCATGSLIVSGKERKSENSISVCKTLLLSLTLTFHFSVNY